MTTFMSTNTSASLISQDMNGNAYAYPRNETAVGSKH
jgi:hypothetical protein